MSEMVERVAIAIGKAEGYDSVTVSRKRFAKAARAAIEAMLEPTSEMKNAGAFYHIQHAGAAGEHELSMARQTYRAMLKRALLEP